MIRKWFGMFLLVFAAVMILSLSGCGRDQQLVSIQV
jgi:uncharacterized lipoprotein YehR (DUF1307 family)